MAEETQGGNNRAKELTTAEKRAAVARLRTAGASFAQIAVEVGYANAGGAYKAWKAVIAGIQRETADEVRMLEMKRLDEMLVAIWPKVQRADLPAVDRACRIMAERRQYLPGLTVPQSVKAEGTGDGGAIVVQLNMPEPDMTSPPVPEDELHGSRAG